MTSRELKETEQEEFAIAAAEVRSLAEEVIPTRRTLRAIRPEKPNREQMATHVIGVSILCEVLHPYVCQSPASTVEFFAQTKHGRELYNKELKPGEFDIKVPGTIRLEVRPTSGGGGGAPAGYDGMMVVGDPYAVTPLDDGRFTAGIPLALGDTPPISYAQSELENRPVDPKESKILHIKGDDEIFIGFRYKTEEGEVKWLLQSAKLTSDAFFDCMDRHYQEPVTGLFVGQNAYFRVIHPSMDLTDSKDIVEISLTTASGTKKKVKLVETYSHSGIFKGLIHLVYNEAKKKPAENAAKGGPDAKESSAEAVAGLSDYSLPVTYGDNVTITYIDSLTKRNFEYEIEVFKGYDGSVIPFTKRFNDPEIAVQTQFTIAEAYFELAKRHRQLGQFDLASTEIAQGKKAARRSAPRLSRYEGSCTGRLPGSEFEPGVR